LQLRWRKMISSSCGLRVSLRSAVRNDTLQNIVRFCPKRRETAHGRGLLNRGEYTKRRALLRRPFSPRFKIRSTGDNQRCKNCFFRLSFWSKEAFVWIQGASVWVDYMIYHISSILETNFHHGHPASSGLYIQNDLIPQSLSQILKTADYTKLQNLQC
jgi:hypothetical protein